MSKSKKESLWDDVKFGIQLHCFGFSIGIGFWLAEWAVDWAIGGW